MELLILGENSDDKGTQLEALTSDLLRQLGYTNVVANSIGHGGFEIDVSAEFSVPMPGRDGSPIKVFCECKAHSKPIGMTDWLKFLGKLWSQRVTQFSDARGVFIALSGVNGNVYGHYEGVKDKIPVDVVSGERLLTAIQKQFEACTLSALIAEISRMTKRRPVEFGMCYNQKAIFWTVRFHDDTFTLIAPKGCSAKVENADLSR